MIWIAGYRLSKSGTKFEKNNYLIEDPLFVNSEYRHLSQLADCVTYFVKKGFRENEPEESHELFKSYYDRLENKFLKRYSKSKDMESNLPIQEFVVELSGRRGHNPSTRATQS